MSVSSTVTRVAYTGDGATTVFTVPYPFLANSDVGVYVNDVKQVGGFTTSGAGGTSGTVTFATAPSVATSVVLLREQPYTQPTVLDQLGPFPAKAVETMADRMMLGLQQFEEQMGRTMKFPVSDGSTVSQLPAADERKGRVAVFDPATGAAEVSTFTTAQVGAAIASQSLSNTVTVINVVTVDSFAGATPTDKMVAAVAAMEALGQGTVYVPAGTRALTHTITVNVSGVMIEGAGKWDTVYTRSTDYGDTFLFTGNDATGAVISDCGISNLAIVSTGLTTSGAHIHCNGVARFNSHNVYMEDGFIGYKCAGLTAGYISGLYLVFSNLYGGATAGRRYIECSSAAATYGHPSSGDLFFSDFNVRGTVASQVTEYGLLLNSADGIWFDNGHVGNASTANIALNAGDAANPLNLVFFTTVMSDEGAQNSLYFTGNAQTGRHINFSNCLFKGAVLAKYGILTDAVATFYIVNFDNCTVCEMLRNGLDIESPNFNKVAFGNCTFIGNSHESIGAYAGIRLADGVSGISFAGGGSGHNHATYAGAALQQYGISVGNVTNIVIDGMDLTGNVTGSILAPPALTSFLVKNVISQDALSVASAASLALPYYGDIVDVSGTTGITSIQAQHDGREVTLKFSGALTVTDGSNLKLAGNFTTTADDTLTLKCLSSTWYECARSVN